MKKYAPFFILQILANALWVFWSLPEMGETGTLFETASWLIAQALLPIFLSSLLQAKRKSGYWLTFGYGLVFGLYGFGTLGWSLMGPFTPLSVYTVSALFLVIGFGTVFQSLKDLNIGKPVRRYDIEDQ